MKISVAVLFAAVLARFDITVPLGRRFDKDPTTAPCAGAIHGARDRIRFVGGMIRGVTYYKRAKLTINLSLKFEPESNSDFTSIELGQVFVENRGQWEFGPLDLSHIEGIKYGTFGTIQIIARDNHITSYECADVMFE
jgi:hypothetical protein